MFDGLLASLVLLLLLVTTLDLSRRQSLWISPLAVDFTRWLAHPALGSQVAVHASTATGVAALGGSCLIGWLVTSVALSGSSYERSFALKIGTSLMFGEALLGYVGMVALIAGLIYQYVVLCLFVVVASAASVLFILARRSRPAAARSRVLPDPFTLLIAALGIAAVTFIGVHAVLAPVTEWDAVVYHAAAAKLWFLEAPNPPIIFGPSVGIEISANYPPLFPSSGLAVYALQASPDDLVLKIASPMLLIGLLMAAYGYCSSKFGRPTANWAVLILLGTPLIILYGTWSTGYMLVTALCFSTFVLCEEAAQSQHLRLWTSAGVVAGLAILSQFYGLPSIAIAPASLVAIRFSRRNLLGILVFGLTAAVVASPWLVRNARFLGDPLYPIPIPLAHPVGLFEPIWSASQAEIRNNALGQWSATGHDLLMQQLGTILFDPHSLPIGMLFALLVGAWRITKGDRWSAYAIAVTSVFVATMVAPGWFFVRALIVVLPLVAVLSARALTMIAAGDPALAFQPNIVVKALSWLSQVTVFVACSVIALSLSIAGPNQDNWTTDLDQTHDLMGAVRVLGSDSKSLYNVYSGDSLCWQWLNSNLAPTARVATLDDRIYYLKRPQHVFYLDGVESHPLYAIHDPMDARAYLQKQGIEFVMIPGWTSTPGPAQHPAIHLLPLIPMLGTHEFPIAAMFGGLYRDPTVVYSVGPYHQVPQVGVFPGAESPTRYVGVGDYAVSPGDPTPRLFAPSADGGPTSIHFQFKLGGSSRLSVNQWDPVRMEWIDGIFTEHGTDATRDEWLDGDVPLPDIGSGYTTLGVYAVGETAYLRNVELGFPLQPLINPGAGTSAGDGTYTFASRDTSDRIAVPIREPQPTVFSFQYHDSGQGHFDLEHLDPMTGRWDSVRSATLDNRGGWLTVAVPVHDPGPYAEFGIFSDGPALGVRALTETDALVVASPAPHDPGAPYLFPQGSTSGRILVPMRNMESAVVSITYQDSAGSFRLNVLDSFYSGAWQFGPVVSRRGTGRLVMAVVALRAGPPRIVEIGPYATGTDLVLSNVSVAPSS